MYKLSYRQCILENQQVINQNNLKELERKLYNYMLTPEPTATIETLLLKELPDGTITESIK